MERDLIVDRDITVSSCIPKGAEFWIRKSLTKFGGVTNRQIASFMVTHGNSFESTGITKWEGDNVKFGTTKQGETFHKHLKKEFASEED